MHMCAYCQRPLPRRPQSHLRWERVHLVGHSMGGMAAMKLAAAQPRRIISLTIISSTGGGWEAIPSTWRAIRYAWMVGALHSCAQAVQ